MEMDLDPATEAAEMRLQDHNDAEDARCFILDNSADAAVNLDAKIDPVAGGTGTGSMSPTNESTVEGDRARKKRSKAWNDFTEVIDLVNGKRVRVSAICIHCKAIFSTKFSGGTGHLLRHVDTCVVKKEKERSGRIQSVLKYNPDGSLMCCEYSDARACTELCHSIAKTDLPISFVECAAFEEYIVNAHNPRFVKTSRQTIARDLIKIYNECMDKLIETLKNFVSSVSITSDIWSGKAKEDYICVVAHYANSNWELEKRLLGLRPIEVAHTGRNIADRVHMVVDDFCISDKIFSIILDNASANKNVVFLNLFFLLILSFVAYRS
jgi:hypothetical protein